MAEFCLKCYNEMENKSLTKDNVVLSKELELCEGCSEMKHTIVKIKKKNSKVLLWVIIANVILWTTLILLIGKPTPAQETISTPERLAYTAATQMMKDNYLKVPSSAKFQPFEEITIASDENTYYVRLWIEAQNALGVSVKTYYTITVRYEPELEQWRFIDYTED